MCAILIWLNASYETVYSTPIQQLIQSNNIDVDVVLRYTIAKIISKSKKYIYIFVTGPLFSNIYEFCIGKAQGAKATYKLDLCNPWDTLTVFVTSKN